MTKKQAASRAPIGTKVAPAAGMQVSGSLPFSVGPSSYRNSNPFIFGAGNILAVPRLESATREVIRERNQGVANARKVDRDNPHIKSGITKRAVNIVGADLKLKVRPNWQALGLSRTEGPRFAADLAAIVEPLFEVWGNDPRLLCDAARRGTFGAKMLLAARNVFGAEGECFIISRFDQKRQRKLRAQFATFIEVVDPTRISTPHDLAPSRFLQNGKQLDEYGAATGFYIESVEPSGDSKPMQSWQLIPREDKWGRPIGIHWFFESRAGAQRAMPAIIASLRHVKMLDDFDDATLQTAVVNAILSIFVESDSTAADVLAKLQAAPTKGGSGTSDLLEMWDKRFDFYNTQDLQANGSRIPVLPPGDKIHMQTANRAADSTKDFRMAFHRAFASELNLNYEMFSSDYSEGSFAKARQSLIDLWRIVTCDRILFTSHVARQIYVGFFEELYLTGYLPMLNGMPDFWDNISAYTGCEFIGPAMGWVDPNKDIEATNKRVASGMGNIRAEAFNQGEDIYRNIDDMAAVHQYAESQGVLLPTMIAAMEAETARKAAMTATTAAEAPEDPDPAEEETDDEEDSQ